MKRKKKDFNFQEKSPSFKLIEQFCCDKTLTSSTKLPEYKYFVKELIRLNENESNQQMRRQYLARKREIFGNMRNPSNDPQIQEKLNE